MTPRRLVLRLLVLGVAVASLAPLARFAAAWAAYAETVGGPLRQTPPRGYTGVRWTDADGRIVAADVFAGSPADDAGVRPGDRLVSVDAEPVRTAADAEARTERAAETVQALRLDRGGRTVAVDVPVAHYPT
ncbi:MAG TPA: PDZ domain-containing protein, partial [Rubricoccaceae bacterium]